MPKVPTYHWSFHRHFSPLISLSVFPPERAVTPPLLTQHKTFSREDEPAALQGAGVPAQQPSITKAKEPILKPRGEVSRINRGGYNLQDKLGWPAADYEEIRAFVVQLAKEHLVTTRPWGRQSQEQLKIVFRAAKERYPMLKDYDGDWVVSDFLRMYLKNTSGRGN